MNTLAMAKAYISDARRSFEEAKQNYESQIYHRCVRRCQECVELALKGILRLFSVEYPKKHDVSEALDHIKHIPAAPDWLKSEVDRFKRISLTLALMRDPAFYETALMQIDRGFYDLAAFSLEQALQLSLKAHLLKLGVDYPRTHSVRKLLRMIYRVTGRKEIEEPLSRFSVELGGSRGCIHNL